MTDTMIERIARRLCERDGGDPDEIRQGEGKAAGQSWTGWQAYASDAKELIAAMFEPTAKMVEAGEAWRAHSSDTDGIYSEMIRAAAFENA
jgi:hypothetical protein